MSYYLDNYYQIVNPNKALYWYTFVNSLFSRGQACPITSMIVLNKPGWYLWKFMQYYVLFGWLFFCFGDDFLLILSALYVQAVKIFMLGDIVCQSDYVCLINQKGSSCLLHIALNNIINICIINSIPFQFETAGVYSVPMKCLPLKTRLLKPEGTQVPGKLAQLATKSVFVYHCHWERGWLKAFRP